MAKKKGRNNFAYFNKNKIGRYECTSKKTAKLTKEQKHYLDDLYNSYHDIRHQYTHWSVDDSDTPIITSIEKAHEYLTEGLILINKYYKLF